MRSINKATLIGNLGTEPEMRHTTSGQAVCSFSLATNESWGGKDGSERQERTEWHKVVAWGRLAEICAEYLKKGRQVYIEGRIQTRSWQDKDGNKRYTTEINANTVNFIGPRTDGGGSGGSGSPSGGNTGGGGSGPSSDPGPPMDDNIPF